VVPLVLVLGGFYSNLRTSSKILDSWRFWRGEGPPRLNAAATTGQVARWHCFAYGHMALTVLVLVPVLVLVRAMLHSWLRKIAEHRL
jgi:hypothetical protein